MSLAKVKEQVTELTQQERSDLQAFLQSLDEETLSPAWIAEVSRRREDFDSGQTKFLTHDEVFTQSRVKK